MRQVYENWWAVREQAEGNARRIHQRFSWAAAAETLIDKLYEHLLAPTRAVVSDPLAALAAPDRDPEAPLDAEVLALM
jgi:hypothetical protein